MKPLDIIYSLSECKNKEDKKDILIGAWESGCEEFFAGLQMAYDPWIVFGLKKVPKILDEDEDGVWGWKDFVSLTNDLRSGKLSDNDIRDSLAEAVDLFSVREWNQWYRKILMKNLVVNISISEINEFLVSVKNTSYIIRGFSCQTTKDFNGNIKTMNGKWYAEQSMGGTRILSVLNKDSGMVTQYSADGNIINDFTDITKILKNNILPSVKQSIVLDGEITNRSSEDLDPHDGYTNLVLYDIIPLKNFMEGYYNEPQQDRHNLLCEMIGLLQHHSGGKIYVLPKLFIDFDESMKLQ